MECVGAAFDDDDDDEDEDEDEDENKNDDEGDDYYSVSRTTPAHWVLVKHWIEKRRRIEWRKGRVSTTYPEFVRLFLNDLILILIYLVLLLLATSRGPEK